METKTKMKNCIVCGRRIKTGRKYCYEHRNTRIKKEHNIGFWSGEALIPKIFVVGGLILTGMYFISYIINSI